MRHFKLHPQTKQRRLRPELKLNVLINWTCVFNSTISEKFSKSRTQIYNYLYFARKLSRRKNMCFHCYKYPAILNSQGDKKKIIHLLCSFYVFYCFFSLILLFVQKTQFIQGEWHQVTVVFYLLLTRKSEKYRNGYLQPCLEWPVNF